MNAIDRTRDRLRGAVAVEYIAIAGLIGVALIAGAGALGGALDGKLDLVAESIGPTAPTPATRPPGSR